MANYILKPEYIKLIHLSENETIFFHVNSLRIYSLSDADLILFLNRYRTLGYSNTKKHYSISEFKYLYSFINKNIVNGPLTLKTAIPSLLEEEYDTIVLPIAAGCNLNCPYCFAQTDGGFHFKNFTREDIQKVIHFVMKDRKDKTKPLVIVFFGGEPLLKFDIIDYTINYLKDNYPDFNIHYSITTNGTILNDKIIKTFKDNNFSILVSLDGFDNDHNVRKYHNGNSSVNDVLENIKVLKNNGIYPEIRATLVNNNPYIVDTFRFFEELKTPYNIVFAYSSENKNHHLADYDQESLYAINTQFKELLEYFSNKIKAKQLIYNKAIKSIFPTFRYRINKMISCSAGINYFTITANGDIYSCAHLMNHPEHKIGNISTGVIDKTKYIPTPIDEIDECKSCWAKYLCLGSCFSQKIATGKDNRSAKQKNDCDLEKQLWEFYIKLYYRISIESPEFIKEFD